MKVSSGKLFLKKNETLFCILILAIVPIISCLIKTLSTGHGIGDVWLGNSLWNDELFYYKQVECMAQSGMPKGYFGYNESVANSLSFGAWSPFALIPWTIWAKIFGWSYISPIIFNIFFMCVAMALFGYLAKPGYYKTILISGLFLLTMPLARYMLSCMSEIICIAMIIIFFGLLVGYENSNRKTARLVFMLIILFWLTTFRAYFAPFFAFPYFAVKKGELKKRISIVAVMVISVIVYLFIRNNLISPYLGDVYNSNPFLGGIGGVFKNIAHYTVAIGSACIGGLRSGYAIGLYFGMFCLITLILLIESIICITKKRSAYLPIFGFVSNMAMLLATVLMYNLQDGYRHLLSFIVLGEFIIVYTLHKLPISEITVAIALTVLFVVRAKDPMYFGIPYDSMSEILSKKEAVELREKLSSQMVLDKSVSWDNTVCLVFMDYEKDADADTKAMIPWQYAYSLPAGFAISLCEDDYVAENINTLKCRYIMTQKGGHVETLIPVEAVYLAGDDDISVYALR